jgi:hypothetical protein
MKLSINALVLAAALVSISARADSANSAEFRQDPLQSVQQMPGVDAVFGREYTIGTISPINVVVREARFALGLQGAEMNFAPSVDERLLVIRYTVRNPQNEPLSVNWNDVRLVAVDANSQSYENIPVLRRDGTVQSAQTTLMPAQKMDVYTALIVPAREEIPKLILMRGPETAPVLRYDLRKRTTALPAFLTDENGYPRSTLAGGINAVYPLALFDAIVEGVRPIPAPTSEQEIEDTLPELIPERGFRVVVVPVLLRNRSIEDYRVRENIFAGSYLEVESGRKYEATLLVAPTLDEKYDGLSRLLLRTGESGRAMFAFHIRENEEPKTLHLMEVLPREDLPSRMISIDLKASGLELIPEDHAGLEGNRRFPAGAWDRTLRGSPWEHVPSGIFNPRIPVAEDE